MAHEIQDQRAPPASSGPIIDPLRAFPALQDYLRDIYEPDAQPGRFRRH